MPFPRRRARALGLALLLTLLLAATTAVAQQPPAPGDAPPATPAPLDAAQVQALATSAALTLAEAEAALDRAQSATDLAFNLLGLFEALSLIVTVAVGVLGAVGFLRLLNAQNELTAARDQIRAEVNTIRAQSADELSTRQSEFARMEAASRDAVNALRAETENATLALALQPLGERQYRARDFEGALATYARALSLDGNNPVTHYRMAYVLTQAGRLEEAESHFQRALAIDGAFDAATAGLGLVYRRMGERAKDDPEKQLLLFNQAERYMLNALTQSPSLVDDDGESWWCPLGGLYRRRGLIAEAVRAYERGRTVTPHSSYPFSNLAMLYGMQNERAAMLHMYRRVEQLAAAEVQAEVDNYWAYFDLLAALLAQGKVGRADEIFETAMSTVPDDAVYAFDTLRDTLLKVAQVLHDTPQAAMLHQFATRVEATGQARAQAPSLP